MEKVIEPYRYRNEFYMPYIVAYKCEDSIGTCQDLQSCSFCFQTLEPGIMRTGIRIESCIDLKWYHTDCFWVLMKNGSNKIFVDLVDGLDQLREPDQKKFVKNLKDYQKTQEVGKNSNCIWKRISGGYELRPEEEKEESLVLIMSTVMFITNEIEDTCTICSETINCDSIKLVFNDRSSHYNCALKSADVIIGSVEGCSGFKELAIDVRHSIKEDYCYNLRMVVFDSKSHEKLRLLGEKDKIVLMLSMIRVWPSNGEYVSKCDICNKAFGVNELISALNGRWSHPECLFRKSSVIFGTPDNITDWEQVGESVKATVWEVYNKTIQAGVVAMTFPKPSLLTRKRAAEEEENAETDEESLRMEQVSLMNTLRQEFKELDLSVINEIIEFNKQKPFFKIEEAIEELIDISVFGPPDPCPICKQCVTFIRSRSAYVCIGYLTDFTSCKFETRTPTRRLFTVPDSHSEVFARWIPQLANKRTRYYAGGNNAKTYSVAPPKSLQNASKFWDHELRHLFGSRPKTNQVTSEWLPSNVFKEDEITYHAKMSNVNVERRIQFLFEIYIFQDKHENFFCVYQKFSETGSDFLEIRQDCFNDKSSAKVHFENQFHKATGSLWCNRNSYKKLPGFYLWNKLDFIEVEFIECSLIPERAIEFLMDVLKLETQDQLKNRQIRVRMSKSIIPCIASYSKELVSSAFESLREKLTMGTSTELDQIDASNIFHSVMPAGRDIERLRVLRTETEISHACDLMKNNGGLNFFEKVHDYFEVPELYVKVPELKIKFKPVPRRTSEWNLLKTYLTTSIGTTHDIDIQLLEIFEITRTDGPPFESGENTMLLWHGTSIMYLADILKDGLKVPTGENRQVMFGNGIYFADAFSKSIFYSLRLRRVQFGICYVLLCEVSLGKVFTTPNAKTQDEVTDLLSQGFDSIKGTGKWIKNEENQILCGNMKIPTGPLIRSQDREATLNYNEYVVYKPNNVRVKYIVQVNVKQAQHIV